MSLSLYDEVHHKYKLACAELREATEALDDPAVNNIRTLPEGIRLLRVENERLRVIEQTEAAMRRRLEEVVADCERLGDRTEERDDSNRNLTAALKRETALAARLQKVMARCADLLDEDQFNELDAIASSTSVVKPCEICTTQSWCETHGCQCYPVSAVQPERCCLDYPRCDCNSPPEPDNEWHCSQYPGCECFAGCREKALERQREPLDTFEEGIADALGYKVRP